MDFDFSLVLVIAVGITGAVYLLDVLLLGRQRKAALAGYRKQCDDQAQQPEPTREEAILREPIWVEYPKAFFPVLFVVLVLRSFLFEPFKIPSGSMIPTLDVGDYILVNKYAYGLRLPVLGTEIVPIGLPQRGDILVFRYPENPRINYIKRVIGVPGDIIRYENKQLYVNGEKVPVELVAQIPPGIPQIRIYTEQLGDAEYRIQHELRRPPDGSGTWLVGEGQYFTLGDNRDNSRDSRYWNFVPENHIVGKAVAVWMHMPGWIPSFQHNRVLD